MKKLLIICIVTFLLAQPLRYAFAIQYCKDFLEPGNPGGWESSLKTFDDAWTLHVGEEVAVDIWLNDVPEKLLHAGFWIDFDSEALSLMSVEIYDGFNGPWDPGFTHIVKEITGPGTLFILLGQYSCPSPDPEGDIILAKVRFRCLSPGNTAMTIRPTRDPGFATVVGCSAFVYDSAINPNLIAFSQISCAVVLDCDDYNLCTTNSCETSTGTCFFNQVIDCDDDNLCTSDSCNPITGQCLFDPVDCNDWNACTADSCDSATGQCVYNPLDCSFGYFTDFLESGNPGGWTGSLKTFDESWTLSPGAEVEMDVWLNDVPGPLLTGGFWVEYDPSLVSIVDIKVYDGDLWGTNGMDPCCPGLPGPWDPGYTDQFHDPGGPGNYYVSLNLAQNGCGYPDAGGDMILGRIRWGYKSKGDVAITIKPLPDRASFVGCTNNNVYDPRIASHTIILHQSTNPGNQAIPTLNEWGMIIVMTIILGTGVVFILRKKMA